MQKVSLRLTGFNLIINKLNTSPINILSRLTIRPSGKPGNLPFSGNLHQLMRSSEIIILQYNRCSVGGFHIKGHRNIFADLLPYALPVLGASVSSKMYSSAS
ncbi:hypothetical protein [Desulfosporosinus sp. OT]|uniref:hypothetical protein n=1 Tax=Desulfosporosinus sp. OT TaxID=913865 RepID=UPI001A98466E|nr:hypothetical protein [Desulfosporosinus sp. OT]